MKNINLDIEENFMKEKTLLLDDIAVERAIKRISHEIVEKNKGVDDLVLLGILRRGVPFAEKIVENVYSFENIKIPCGKVDISFYRDDVKKIAPAPVFKGCEVPCDVEGKNVILCDDVLYTGRTARAAMEAVLAIGRPKTIRLAVLIDRGHRELPIRADFVGKNVPTGKTEVVKVRFPSIDGCQDVKLFEAE